MANITPETLEELLPTAAAAKLIFVSVTTLRNLADNGKIACTRYGPGRHRRFNRKDLLAFARRRDHDTI